jgi:beta-galactosidase
VFSRRTVLQAGLVGAATLAYGTGVRSPMAEAAVQQDAALAAGAYELNQHWLFGGTYASGAEAVDYPESGFSDVTLPHTVASLSWGDWDRTTWEQVWIYRKHINQAAVAGGRAFIDFQGVMTSATVYLNGVQISQHEGGYLPWSVELTGHLSAGDNVLAVVVDSRWLDVPPDNFPKNAAAIDYLQPGGIYRDVGLRIVPDVFLSDVFAKPTNVLTSPGVDVQFTIDAASVPAQPAATVTAVLLDGATELGSATGTASVTATGDTVTTISITGLRGLTLWSPEDPKLYQVSATVTADGVSHTLPVRIGFRQATFETGGFFLNGHRYEIFGLNRHQLFPYTGMAAPERLQRRDAELLRNELNCNMVRCSHYPQSPHFLDACDELGLMVWEEPPGWQYVGDAAFQQIVLQNVQDMVVRDRNRPSVIVWAVQLNETSSQNNHALYVQTRQLAETFDGSRQTTGAMSTQSTTGWAQDVFAYDDYQSVNGNHTDATLSPPVSGVPYMISEAVGALDGAPLYRWVDTEATLALQAKMHAQVHNIAQSNAAYAGLLGWAGIDYASLSGGNRVWHNIKWPGVLDTFRIPKPGAAFYRSQTGPSAEPVILPVFFWDFGSGSPANGPGSGAMIATNCDQLQVFVGGAQVATGTPDTTDYAHLAHPPVFVDLTSSGAGSPELRIDGYVSGQKVTSLSMSCDTTQDRLSLTIEDASIGADGSDMTRFTFRALDRYGNQRPYPTGDVTLALTGPATLIAQNPFPFAEYGGAGGGFIRSELGGTGVVTVTATHPTLGQASAQLTAVAVPVTDVTGGAPGSSPPAGTPTAPAPPGAGGARTAPPVAGRTPVPKSRVRSALAAVLSPTGIPARIGRLLRNSGYTINFDAPSPGRLVIGWYHVTAAGHEAGRRRSRRVLVAAASATIRRAGHARIKLKLTPSGRSLLRHARQERLTVEASFTPTGQAKTTSTKVIRLRR